MKIVELIVPCYNEAECVNLFYERVKIVFESFKDYDFFVTYVDDGSRDHTLPGIKKIVKMADKGKVQYFIVKKFWKRICDLCRFVKEHRGLCGGKENIKKRGVESQKLFCKSILLS